MQVHKPFVTFVLTSMQTAVNEEGKPVYTDVPVAHITPYGCKDIIERKAADWLAEQASHALSGTIPHDWLESYRSLFRDFQAMQEVPVGGYALKNWSMISKANLESCLGNGIKTVEQLAAASEDVLNSLNIPTLLIKQAQLFLAPLDDVKVENLRLVAENETLKNQLAIERTKVQEAKAELQKLAATTPAKA